MSQNENTLNPADTPKPEFADTVNINKIEGKEIFITGYVSNFGKPNEYTKQEDIREDGLTEYRTVTTEQTFELAKKKGGEVLPINHFYVTPAIAKQITGLPNYKEALESGKRIGPVKAVKRAKTDNPSQSYWCLAYENDPDFN